MQKRRVCEGSESKEAEEKDGSEKLKVSQKECQWKICWNILNQFIFLLALHYFAFNSCTNTKHFVPESASFICKNTLMF